MRIVILDTPEDVAEFGCTYFIDQINNKPDSVLGLATGSTPVNLYQKLCDAYLNKRVSFQSVQSFNLDEYLGLAPEHPQSYRYFMNQNLFNQIDIKPAQTHVPDGMAANPKDACLQYEQNIQQAGGIDLQLLGIGRNGHIGFNEPSSSLSSRTRIKTLTQDTVEANKRFFSEDEFQPRLSLTMGIGTIMEARRILLLATGSSKAEAVRNTIEGPLSASCPASILQMHPDVTIVLDKNAALGLKDLAFYQYIEAEQQRLSSQFSKSGSVHND